MEGYRRWCASNKGTSTSPKNTLFAVDDGDPTRQAARKKLQATLGETRPTLMASGAEAVELLHRKWPNLAVPDQKETTSRNYGNFSI